MMTTNTSTRTIVSDANEPLSKLEDNGSHLFVHEFGWCALPVDQRNASEF
jgi:hypothetical protein